MISINRREWLKSSLDLTDEELDKKIEEDSLIAEVHRGIDHISKFNTSDIDLEQVIKEAIERDILNAKRETSIYESTDDRGSSDS